MMTNLIQKIVASIYAPLFAFGIGCSKPEDDGRCEYNEYGDCVQTYSGENGRCVLTVTYMNNGGIRQELTVRERSRTRLDEGCSYKIQSDFFGIKLIEKRNCSSSLDFFPELYFEAGRNRTMKTGFD